MQSEHPPFRGKLALLFVLAALSATTAVALVTVNSIVGLALVSDPRWATLPITAYVVGSALSTFAASLFMARFGRTAGFRLGIAASLLGSVCCGVAAQYAQFWLLCVGAAIFGAYVSTLAYARFAASEIVPDAYRSRAIAWVMSAGIVGALLGAQSTRWTKDLTDHAFVGTYASLAVLAVVSFGVCAVLDLPKSDEGGRLPQLRHVASIAANPQGRTATISSVVGYAVMVFLMTATPIAMSHHHHHYDDTALVIQWHVLGMYAPSFVTGALIRRLGVRQVMFGGVVLMLGCVVLNFTGTSFLHFWSALLLLGVGWNFMFIGGTTMLSEAFDGEARFLAQGTNEVLVFGANAVASGAAGYLLHRVGWQWTNLVALPFLAVASGFILQRRTAVLHIVRR